LGAGAGNTRHGRCGAARGCPQRVSVLGVAEAHEMCTQAGETHYSRWYLPFFAQSFVFVRTCFASSSFVR